MKAKSSEQYRQAWESHLAQFSCVFLEAKIPYEEWDATKCSIQKAIDKAVANLEEEGTWNEPSS